MIQNDSECMHKDFNNSLISQCFMELFYKIYWYGSDAYIIYAYIYHIKSKYVICQ